MKKNKNEKKDERRLINKEINMNVTLVLYLRHLGIIFDSQRERKILFNIWSKFYKIWIVIRDIRKCKSVERVKFSYNTKKLDIKIQDIEHNLIQYIWSQSEDLYIITLIPEYHKKKRKENPTILNLYGRKKYNNWILLVCFAILFMDRFVIFNKQSWRKWVWNRQTVLLLWHKII